MKPAGVWIDAENYPDPADPAYADITPVWTRATGRPAGELPEVARAALHTSAVLICEALGWHDGDVITAAANGPGMVSDHWWEPDQIPQGTAGSLFTHIDPAQSPPEFARRLSVAQAKGCTSVFIYADDVSADQLASHGDALRGLGAS
jgi:hypothetical protein